MPEGKINQKRKVALIILDGWGIGPAWGGNAITQAKVRNFDLWWRTYTHTSLLASGEAVGLPAGTAGNSETGHLNIGAGRVVPQDLVFINNLIKSGQFFKNQKILAAFEHAKKNNSALHLMGLVGRGHVHSDINHLFSLLKMAKENQLTKVYLDLFTDGRDSDPESALGVFEDIECKLKEIGVGKISSICGRYFALDRDKNWGRTSRTYNVLTKGEANISPSSREAISRSYLREVSDEYIIPTLIADKPENKIIISDNDAVIFFNFRPDRARQLSQAFLEQKIPAISDRKILNNIYFLTFVNRDQHPIGIMAFQPEEIKNSLAEVVSNAGFSQFHIAETEKYAHVTYFIDGGREKPFPREYHQMIPSPKVSTYDLTPTMSAGKITDSLISNAGKNFDLIICNYANADMVGHVGNFYAAVQAIEFIDFCLERLIKILLLHNYTVAITSDHGNAEEMINPKTNQSQTEHTSNPVPFMIISKEIEIGKKPLLSGGSLSNIAPTLLQILEISKPAEMTAESLFAKVPVSKNNQEKWNKIPTNQ